VVSPLGRQERERAFHDTLFARPAGQSREGADRFWPVAESSVQVYWGKILHHASGKVCLEIGSGTGTKALELAPVAQHVTGIDISSVAVDQANNAARSQGNGDRVTFAVAEGEELSFPDDSFDVVFGSSVLHHLSLDKALPEIARVLKPNGVAFFYEPMGHNPAINWFRRRTPEIRTPDERPLLQTDLSRMEDLFEVASFEFYHLFSIGAALLAGKKGFDETLRVLNKVDRVALSQRSPARLMAWCCVIDLERPRISG